MANEYDSQGRLILRDSQGTEISMYRFFQLSLKPPAGGYAYPGRTTTKYGNESHIGYDFPCTRRSEIRSTCEGTVAVVRGGITQEGNSSDNGGMGNSVIIQEEGTDRHHRYMHMIEDPVVNEGEKVYQGTLLGYSGSTGDSSGPHLHYDIQNGLWGSQLDAWEQFSNGSQPAGWTPRKVTDASEANRQNWSCIEDTNGIDYGGGGSGTGNSVPPFTTDKDIFDVSHYNLASLGHISTENCGGLIVQVCRARTGGASDDYVISAFKQWVSTYKGTIPLGFYFYSYLPFETDESSTKSVFKSCFQLLTNEGITPKDVSIGVWLDLETDGPTPSSPSVNINQVKWFREVATDLGYVTAGLYSNAAYIGDLSSSGGGNFNDSDLIDVPIWVAWLGKDAQGVLDWGSIHGYQKVYLLQDSWTYSVGFGDLDHDVVVQPIPVVGSGSTQTIIEYKKIIFDPTPGLINKDTLISITTDVENGVVRYTADNSAPTPESTILEEGHKIAPWLIPHRSWNFRAAVFDEATGEVLAQGTGTYIWPWERPKGEDVEGILKHIEEEENLQSYLSYHPEDESVKTIESYTESRETSNAE